MAGGIKRSSRLGLIGVVSLFALQRAALVLGCERRGGGQSDWLCDLWLAERWLAAC